MSNQIKENFIIRDATKTDCKSIYSLIVELAEYEKLAHQIEMTVEQLEEDGFGSGHPPRFLAIVVEKISTNPPNQLENLIVGFLLYVQKYSTLRGSFLWIEDFYVKPEYRRHGLGQSLISTIVRKAHSRNMPSIEWNVLGWNQLAIGFYQNKLGAIDMYEKAEWHTYRLPKDRFQNLLNVSPENVKIESTESFL